MENFRLLGFSAVFLLTACTDSNGATTALTKAGFTDVETRGYAWFACSDDDFYRTRFIAKNAQGQVVEGVVCSGLVFKSATIRF